MNVTGGPGRGFTVIELLVVMAIIGILAGITLAVLSTARNKGSDSAIKAELNNIRNAAAEQYYLANNGYGTSSGTAGSCGDGSPNGSAMWADTASSMDSIISAIEEKVGAGVDCGTNTSAWSVAVQLPTGSYWCVDSMNRVSGTSSSTGMAYTSLNSTGSAGAHSSAGATSCN